jgi:hypothetical protein
MRSLAPGNSDRVPQEPLDLRPTPETDVLPGPEGLDFTEEEVLAALLNEPEPPSGSEHRMKNAPMARVAMDLT